MAIIFSLEEGELGKKRHIRIGIMSNFVKRKRCHWCEWKETLQGKIHLLLAIQWAAEDGGTHLSPVLAAIPAAPGLLLCSSLRHRHRTAWKPAFGRWHWRTLTWLLLMSCPSPWKQIVHGWEQTPNNFSGCRDTGSGLQQCPGPSLGAGRCAKAAALTGVKISSIWIKEGKERKTQPEFQNCWNPSV